MAKIEYDNSDHQYFEIKFDDEKYSYDDKKLIGKLVVRKIKDRTNSGISMYGRKFQSPKYSDEYAESLDFKIAGKSKGRVDLQQSGDMLGELDVIKIKSKSIIIGYKEGTDGYKKASWQQQSTTPGYPHRRFVGITEKELNEILSQVTPIEDLSTKQEAKREKEYESDKDVETMADKIFKLWGV